MSGLADFIYIDLSFRIDYILLGEAGEEDFLCAGALTVVGEEYLAAEEIGVGVGETIPAVDAAAVFPGRAVVLRELYRHVPAFDRMVVVDEHYTA